MQDMDFKESLGCRVLKSVEQFPDRPALWAAGDMLTYQEMIQQAQSLAQVALPVRDDLQPKVGVFAYRSAAAYCGILGALLAGAAYVPLNPRFPVERTRLMVEQADLQVLLVDRACEKKAAALLVDSAPGYRVVLLEQDEELPDWAEALKFRHDFVLKGDIPSYQDWSEPQQMSADDLAYLLFTSGTTGRPKGVGVSHGNVKAFP